MKSNDLSSSSFNTALMLLQCEFVAERNRVNPQGVTWLQYDIMFALTEGSVLPSVLSERLGISRSKLSKNLGELKSLGYVEQVPGSGDRRELQTTLSLSGLAFMRNVDRQHQELADVARSVWSAKEQSQFEELSQKLVKELRNGRSAR
ncbi:MarR family winged helix-turn-helix transcriptional regulator [Bifidobacterium sp.]|jgi:DNA-binding MarR family transcriptional regulator|uniref:MarR family winged helix-turn-helix transcriptional regulator n=1 Tax=Bifidobacterium sp. TaxID=41200 RepID=UPI0025BCA748|nr:MarR family winged helix-turn-helix transcriptional regulator [Bifidobacterium sp.]MCI1636118.1 MarR family winged helix-turn-helix transcriptional regulator [Bifidobacterium sp.]